MPLLRVNKKNVLFVHIPKTGGETVEHYLRQVARIGFFHSNSRQRLFDCTPQHFDNEIYRVLFPAGFVDYSFAFVRHPVDRIISEYKMRIGSRFQQNKPVLTFSQWLEKSVKLLQEVPRYLDNHLTPQSKFLNPKTKLFFFESGIELNLRQVGKDIGVEFNFSEIIHRQKSFEGAKLIVKDSDLNTIKSIYSEDFLKFGYRLEDSKYLN